MRSFLPLDLRDALRSLRATPVITAVALLSLALGIGANTAIFSILNGLVLKPLPVRQPQQLVMIDHGSWTNPIWEAIRDRTRAQFAGAFAWSDALCDLAEGGQRDLVDASYASGSMFTVLGIQPVAGRLFTDADDVRGGGPDGPVAVISHRLWQQRFGGQASVVGQRLMINRVPFTIVGVMPGGFFGPDVGRSADVIMPLGTEAAIKGTESMLDHRSAWFLEIMIRLAPGQTRDQAAAVLNGARPSVREATLPADWDATMLAGYLTDEFALIDGATGRSPLRNRYAQPLTIIMVVVAAVLLIACANIANLLLARATARRHEMSVRMALGASRWTLARQLFAESLLLAIAGGAAGLALAQFGSALLIQQLATSSSQVMLNTAIDWRVLGFTSAIALTTTVMFGLAPAMGLAAVAPNDALKEQSRSVTGDRRFGLRNGLVIIQVALSLSLVAFAGLFVGSFTSLTSTPLGFDPTHLLLVNIGAQTVPVGDERAVLYGRARDAVASVPGVRRAAASLLTPISGGGWNGFGSVDGGPPLVKPQSMIWINPISSEWFATYGMTLQAGRDFSVADSQSAEPVAIVNETFVKRFVGAQNPIGARLKADIGPGGEQSLRIVGVVSDAVYRNARAGVYASVYLPIVQAGELWSTFAITADVAAGGESTRRGIAAALSRADARMSFSFRDLSDQVRASVAQERLVALLSGFFGVLALLLAGIGLYGVTSYAVSRRRSEIAVRMAMGATAGGVVRLVLRRVGALVIVGVAVGLALTWWASTFVGKLLFGLTPRDPMTLVTAAVVLILSGLAAAWLPARRATHTDPLSTLRE